MKNYVILFLLALLLLIPESHALTMILNETNGGNVGDSLVFQGFPTTNYGTLTYLNLYDISGSLYRSFILWNLSGIPSGATIQSAILNLYDYQYSTPRILAYNTTPSWTETGLTWNNQPSSSVLQDNITVSGNGWIQFNVTNAAISQFANATNKNMSILLKYDNETGIGNDNYIYSKEYAVDATKRPYLNITYTIPPILWSQNSMIINQTTSTFPSTFLCGDVNGNGVNNSADATWLFNYLSGTDGYNSVDFQVSDADGNHVLNMSDFNYLVNHFLFAPGYENLLCNTPSYMTTQNNYTFSVNATPSGITPTFNLTRPNGTVQSYTTSTTPTIIQSGNIFKINFTQAQIGTIMQNGTYNYVWYFSNIFGQTNHTGNTTFKTYLASSTFYARDSSNNATIGTFIANFTNSTTTQTYFTTSGNISIPTYLLPRGNTTLTITASGYAINSSWSNIIDDNSWFNDTIMMTPASLFINTFDEKTLSALTFNVTFANSTTSKTWYNVNNISQLYSNLTLGDTTITISSAGYQTRKYYKTITSTMYETLNAYLLSTASGMTVRFHVVSIADQPIQTVVSTAQLSIGGILTTVEQTTTDSSGTASLFLDPTVTYSISFTHPSYTSNYLSINPTQQDYKITMSGTSNYINNTFQYGDVTVRLTPTGTSLLRHSPGNTTLNYSVSAPSGDLTDWGWFVKWNGTTLYTNSYTAVSGGSDSYFVNTTNLTGLLYVDMFYTKLGTTTWMTNIYTMNNITLGNNTIADIFSRFGTDNYGFQKTNMLFIGFVAIIFMMGYVSQYSVAGAGVIGWLGLVVLSYAGLIATGILVICGIAVLSILIIRGGFN